MPNIIRNRLLVKGQYLKLKEFVQDIKRNENGHLEILDTLYPCPEELSAVEVVYGTAVDGKPYNDELYKDMQQKWGAAHWHDWQKKHWGVKWGDYETVIDDSNEYDDAEYAEKHFNSIPDEPLWIRYYFHTAWNVPVKAFERISRMFPDLHFEIRYIDGGMERKGWLSFDDGSIIETSAIYDNEWDSGIS